jgi:hypothetical protein
MDSIGFLRLEHIAQQELHMVKRIGLVLMMAVVAVTFSGCSHDSGSVFYRAFKHLEWHILGAYKDLVDLHKEIDRYFFDLDERDPDRY